MRQLSISGIVGMDPEIHQAKNGSEFIFFKIANHDYDTDGKEETYWYKIISFSETAFKMLKYIKKGRHLIIHGKCSDKLTKHKKTNKWIINRSVIADRIEFMYSANKEGIKINNNKVQQEKTNLIKKQENEQVDDVDTTYDELEELFRLP